MWKRYFTVKRNEVLIHAYYMDDLENSMLRERSWTQRPRIVWFPLHEIAGRGKFLGPESGSVTARGWGTKEWGVTTIRDRFSFWSSKSVLELDNDDGAHVCEDTKNHLIIHFKWVSFVAYVLLFSFFKKEKKSCWAKEGKRKNSTHINFKRTSLTVSFRNTCLGYNKNFKWLL